MIYGKCADEGDKSVDKLIKYNIEGHHLIILYTFVICIVVVGYIVDMYHDLPSYSGFVKMEWIHNNVEGKIKTVLTFSCFFKIFLLNIICWHFWHPNFIFGNIINVFTNVNGGTHFTSNILLLQFLHHLVSV